jgi:hypothetical protein
MALSSKDNPASAKAEPKPRLAKAAASGNAAVHNLLARRGCTEDPEQIAEIDAELAELGYEL